MESSPRTKFHLWISATFKDQKGSDYVCFHVSWYTKTSYIHPSNLNFDLKKKDTKFNSSSVNPTTYQILIIFLDWSQINSSSFHPACTALIHRPSKVCTLFGFITFVSTIFNSGFLIGYIPSVEIAIVAPLNIFSYCAWLKEEPSPIMSP